jgi:ABC-type bacteriocin/lantibiotic exporter with double-glycine peptidase domain
MGGGRKDPAMRALALVSLLAILQACSHAAPAQPSAQSQDAVYVGQVPFVGSPGDDSGASVLASVLAYYGITRAPAAILEDLPRTLGGGILALDVALYPRRFGLQTVFGRGDLDAMESQLGAGHPVIVMLDDGSAPRYALVVGLDRAHGQVLLYTAERSNVLVPLREFRRSWSRAGHWMTAIERKGRRLSPLPVQSA